MAKLLYSATMSLDGYIAGPGGDMSWARQYFGPNPVAERLVDDIGALLVGARTYRGDDPNRGTDEEGALSGQWHGPVVVLTHHPDDPPPEDATFTDDLEVAVGMTKDAAGGRKYVNVLGADVARQLLRARLLDEILVIVAPLLLGGGTPLLADDLEGVTGPGGYRLERLHESAVPLGVNLWYRVTYDAPPS
ncbi:dihydrofolate reductase family protein [Nocardioides cheoyonin]|uniref:dihydrofolate reductase family protein n=1 Tax=Nocardioides cheoyonin TaxID=3156615 RepID=UPI0032B557A4